MKETKRELTIIDSTFKEHYESFGYKWCNDWEDSSLSTHDTYSALLESVENCVWDYECSESELEHILKHTDIKSVAMIKDVNNEIRLYEMESREE